MYNRACHSTSPDYSMLDLISSRKWSRKSDEQGEKQAFIKVMPDAGKWTHYFFPPTEHTGQTLKLLPCLF
jgi:hypothetical protein